MVLVRRVLLLSLWLCASVAAAAETPQIVLLWSSKALGSPVIKGETNFPKESNDLGKSYYLVRRNHSLIYKLPLAIDANKITLGNEFEITYLVRTLMVGGKNVGDFLVIGEHFGELPKDEYRQTLKPRVEARKNPESKEVVSLKIPSVPLSFTIVSEKGAEPKVVFGKEKEAFVKEFTTEVNRAFDDAILDKAVTVKVEDVRFSKEDDIINEFIRGAAHKFMREQKKKIYAELRKGVAEALLREDEKGGLMEQLVRAAFQAQFGALPQGVDRMPGLIQLSADEREPHRIVLGAAAVPTKTEWSDDKLIQASANLSGWNYAIASQTRATTWKKRLPISYQIAEKEAEQWAALVGDLSGEKIGADRVASITLSLDEKAAPAMSFNKSQVRVEATLVISDKAGKASATPRVLIDFVVKDGQLAFAGVRAKETRDVKVTDDLQMRFRRFVMQLVVNDALKKPLEHVQASFLRPSQFEVRQNDEGAPWLSLEVFATKIPGR